MFNFLKRIFFLFFFILIPTDLYAYLDPGTGSIILQVILGFVAAVVSYFYFVWNKVKSFFKNIFHKNSKKKDE
jgi:hypothetical protein